jgi:hypothetical protein
MVGQRVFDDFENAALAMGQAVGVFGPLWQRGDRCGTDRASRSTGSSGAAGTIQGYDVVSLSHEPTIGEAAPVIKHLFERVA